MTSAKIILFDSVISNQSEGHNLDYIANLKEALGKENSRNIKSIFPFKGIARKSKLFALFKTFCELCKVLRNEENSILIAPNLTNIDWVSLFFIVIRYKKIKFIFFHRRLLKKNGFKNFFINQFFKKTVANNNAYVVSDSKSILRDMNIDQEIFKISIPPRVIDKSFRVRDKINFKNTSKKNSIAFSMVGMLREDKGIDHYKKIIIETLDANEDCFFVLHATCNNELMQNKLDDLKIDFKENKRFFLINSYLDSSEFSWLLNSIDVLILPYDIEEYADGSSGPMAESINLNKTIITTKLGWAIDEFSDYKKIIWLKDLEKPSLKNAIHKAININNIDDVDDSLKYNSFNEDWLRVINEVSTK